MRMAWPDWATLSLRTARQACPDASVHAEVFSPFTHLMELFGYENALMALKVSKEDLMPPVKEGAELEEMP